ncbi:unnamed protein product [Prunus armeniaca]
MSDGELIDYILYGLGYEYKQFTTSLHLRPSLTFDDFFGLLIQEEQLLKRMSSISLSTDTALTSDRNPNDQQQISHNMQYTPNNNSNQGRGRDRNWNSNFQCSRNSICINTNRSFSDYRCTTTPTSDHHPPLLPIPPSQPPFQFQKICQRCN